MSLDATEKCNHCENEERSENAHIKKSLDKLKILQFPDIDNKSSEGRNQQLENPIVFMNFETKGTFEGQAFFFENYDMEMGNSGPR